MVPCSRQARGPTFHQPPPTILHLHHDARQITPADASEDCQAEGIGGSPQCAFQSSKALSNGVCSSISGQIPKWCSASSPSHFGPSSIADTRWLDRKTVLQGQR